MVKPYKEAEGTKKEQVTAMFDNIAPTYDKLNRIMSAGVDISWRRKAIEMLRPYKPMIMADIATGTGDFAVEALRLKPSKVIGIDISPGMLEVGKQKMKAKGIENIVEMRLGDSEHLILDDNSMDAITVGFGVRNFEDLKKGMSEIRRALKPGAPCIVLEPSFPTKFPLKQFFNFHFKVLTPFIGKFISGDTSAYKYLPESVGAFPNGQDFFGYLYRGGLQKRHLQTLDFWDVFFVSVGKIICNYLPI